MQKRISSLILFLAALIFASAVAWQWQTSTGQAVADGHEILASASVADGLTGTEGDGPTTIPIDADTLAQIQKEFLANPPQFENASGLSTAGKEIDIAGKMVKLPDDVYIEAFIVAGSGCADKCPDFPFYALRYKGTDAVVAVGQKTGQIFDSVEDAAKAQSNRAAFAWLVEITETK